MPSPSAEICPKAAPTRQLPLPTCKLLIVVQNRTQAQQARRDSGTSATPALAHFTHVQSSGRCFLTTGVLPKMAWSKSTRIKVMMAIDTAFFFLELISGFLAHSLALTADAFHMVRPSLLALPVQMPERGNAVLTPS